MPPMRDLFELIHPSTVRRGGGGVCVCVCVCFCFCDCVCLSFRCLRKRVVCGSASLFVDSLSCFAYNPAQQRATIDGGAAPGAEVNEFFYFILFYFFDETSQLSYLVRVWHRSTSPINIYGTLSFAKR